MNPLKMALGLCTLALAACSSLPPDTPYPMGAAATLEQADRAWVSSNSSNPQREQALILQAIDGIDVPSAKGGAPVSPVELTPGPHRFRLLFGTSAARSDARAGRTATLEFTAEVLGGRSYVFQGSVDESGGEHGRALVRIIDVGDHSIPPQCFMLNSGDPSGVCRRYPWHPGDVYRLAR